MNDGLSSPKKLAIVLKGWPRLSETFIAQEFVALEQRGIGFEIWSLRRPTDKKRHDIHDALRAKINYLPEYLYQEPLRVVKATMHAIGLRNFGKTAKTWLQDLWRDPTPNRIRRFGQAMVLAREAPPELAFLYAHFLHTPSSVTRYASLLRGINWGFSAHAKDIWTSPDWEKREKLAEAEFGATCTALGAAHLRDLSPDPMRLDLVYHGLDLGRFPEPPPLRPGRDGSGEAVDLVSVGRLVEKKGYDLLLAALAALPPSLNWRLTHIGGGELSLPLSAQAQNLGIADRIKWRGACDQSEVIAALRAADIFVLPSRIATDGDRDGLPNVLMEAASQELPIVATDVSAIPEFIENGKHGVLAEPDAGKLSDALASAIGDPEGRAAMAKAARARLVADFGMDRGIDRLAARLRAALG
jgi:glycosyltransferase involved in cell wall biosynthesis